MLTPSVTELINNLPKDAAIVILTGAGVSQESGVATFRDSNGLWENHRIEEVATPEAYQRNPQLVQTFYNARRCQVVTVHPNKAHQALVQLEQQWKGKFLLVTQNVDDLHDRAGSKNLIHMHGELLKVECTQCRYIWHHTSDVAVYMNCIACKKKGCVRPHIVWFGEMPLAMNRIEQALNGCDLFISIGTSGEVYFYYPYRREPSSAAKPAKRIKSKTVFGDSFTIETVPKFFRQGLVLTMDTQPLESPFEHRLH